MAIEGRGHTALRGELLMAARGHPYLEHFRPGARLRSTSHSTQFPAQSCFEVAHSARRLRLTRSQRRRRALFYARLHLLPFEQTLCDGSTHRDARRRRRLRVKRSNAQLQSKAGWHRSRLHRSRLPAVTSYRGTTLTGFQPSARPR